MTDPRIEAARLAVWEVFATPRESMTSEDSTEIAVAALAAADAVSEDAAAKLAAALDAIVNDLDLQSELSLRGCYIIDRHRCEVLWENARAVLAEFGAVPPPLTDDEKRGDE